MKRKSIIAKGISWLLVTAMLVTGSASGFVFPVHAAGDGIQSIGEADESQESAAEGIQGQVEKEQDELEGSQESADENKETDIEEKDGEGESREEQKEDSLDNQEDSSADLSEETEGNDEVIEGAENEEASAGITIVNSPVVDSENHSITFNLNGATGEAAGAKKVLLMGDVIDDWDTGIEMVKQGDVYTVTVENVNPGVYTYKYVVDGKWITDPHNSKKVSTADGANSVVYMPGLASPAGSISVMKGVSKALPSTLKYYDDKGNFNEVPVSYSIEDGQSNIQLNGDSVTVNEEEGTTVEVTASYEKDGKTETAKVKVSVVKEIYTYNIYYYDFEESRMTKEAAQLWLWEYKVSGGVSYDFTSSVEINGNKWLRASVELPYKDLAIIARSYGAWTWQNSSKGMVYQNEGGRDEVDLYIVSSSKTIYTEAPNLDSLRPRERYMLVEYERQQGDYTNWEVYIWNSGYDTKIPLSNLGGKKVAKIRVMDSVADMTLGFIMRRTDVGTEWAEKDGGDNYINMPADQTVFKVQFQQGKGVVSSTPDNIGYIMDGEKEKIHFYYRDDDKYLNYDMASLEDKVSVMIKKDDGTFAEYAMDYNSQEERFCYDLDISDVESGSSADYQYYYLVDGERVLDKFNEVTGTDEDGQYNSVTYYNYKDKVSLSTTFTLDSMDYNQNNVLKVVPDVDSSVSEENFEIKSIQCDLSQLGGSDVFSINPELMEGTISVTDSIDPGDYTIPIVLYDIYGNKFTTNKTVRVVERTKAEGDFDWDEAIVYFAVTDRFYDGDASNNDAYGVGDYNTSTSKEEDGGGSSYHGGDFAGLTEKLDYLKDLGVNTIWITPIVENITQDLSSTEGLSAYGYHGYWTSDFTKLNKHLGTEEQFKKLIEEAHARGMKLMVDVVINHAGYDTEDYFNSIIKDEEGNPVNMLRDDSNTVDGDTVRDGLSGLPDFVTENPMVRNQLVQWQVDWMEKYDIDYYRVDTVKHVESTTWAAFKNELTKANPEFKMIGEYSGAGYASTGGELGTGSMDALLDFDFNDFAQNFVTGSIENVEETLVDRNKKINNTATMGAFLGSHDEDGFLYRLCSDDDETGAGLSEEEALKLYKVAISLQLTAKGIPVIYYNEEIGLAGANNYPFQENRQDFDWTEAAKQEFEADSILNHYKTLLSIRNKYTALFAKGSRITVEVSDENGYDITSRSYGGETIYMGLNIKDQTQQVAFAVDGEAGTVYRDLYNNVDYTVDAQGKVTVTLPKAQDGGTVILAKQVAAENITAANTTVTINKGDTAKLNVTVTPANTTAKVLWTSSDEKVAVVSKTGTVKGMGAGNAKITAALDDNSGKKVEFNITVKASGNTDPAPVNPTPTPTPTPTNPTPGPQPEQPSVVKVTKLSISGPSKKLAAGKKVTLVVNVTPKNASNKAVTWSTSNKKYATVDAKGKVSLKKAGIGKTVTITATAKDGSKKKATYKIKIMKHAVKSVKLKAASSSVKAGKSVKIKATIKTTGTSVNKTLKWTSSNTKYATVSSKGVVKTKKAGKGKTVTITAVSTDGSNKKAKVKIKIK
ncbi:MAG: alpha-amylase [Lachnospiraceae bacterium]|nr:alpha-amylase [Lachnospiraceae bacterium]